MKTNRGVIHILALLLSTTLLFANSNERKPVTALEKRIETYRKYMRQGKLEIPIGNSTQGKQSIKANPRLPQADKTETRYTRATVGLEEEIKEMEEIKTSYFKKLFSVYQSTGITWSQFIQLLKSKNNLSLKEFKIRSQQLKLHLIKGKENVSGIKIQLQKVLKFHQEIHKTLQEETVSFMGSVYYSKLMRSLSLISFQKDLYHLLLNQVIDKELFTLNQSLGRVENWINESKTINQSNWDKSYHSIALKDSSTLTHQIKEDIESTLTDFQNLKKYFIYAETQLLSSYKEGFTPPGTGSNTNLDFHRFSKIEERLQKRIREFLQQEKVDRAILSTRMKNSSKATLPALNLPALSRHLFFKDKQKTQPEVKPENQEELPDWL